MIRDFGQLIRSLRFIFIAYGVKCSLKIDCMQLNSQDFEYQNKRHFENRKILSGP